MEPRRISGQDANWESAIKAALYRREDVELVEAGAEKNDPLLTSLAIRFGATLQFHGVGCARFYFERIGAAKKIPEPAKIPELPEAPQKAGRLGFAARAAKIARQ